MEQYIYKHDTMISIKDFVSAIDAKEIDREFKDSQLFQKHEKESLKNYPITPECMALLVNSERF
jgi:hypothetical protein